MQHAMNGNTTTSSTSIDDFVNTLKFKDIPKLAKALQTKFTDTKRWSERQDNPDKPRYQAAFANFAKTISGGDINALMVSFLGASHNANILKAIKLTSKKESMLLDNLVDLLNQCVSDNNPSTIFLRHNIRHAIFMCDF